MKQRKAQKIILIIIILLLIVLGGIAYAYFATDIFKTPEQLFVKYLMNNGTQLAEFNFAPFDEILEKMETTPTEISVNTTMKQKDTFSDEENVTMLYTNIKTDLPNRKESLNLELQSQDEYLFGMELAITEDTYGILIKELHDKYLAIENRDLKKIGETFSLDQEILDSLPNKIPETRTLTEEEKKIADELSLKYGKRVLELIDDNMVTLEKNTEVDIDGESIKANKYSLNITEIKLLEIFTTIFEELLNDSQFKELYLKDIDQSIIEEYKTQNEELKTKGIAEAKEENEMILSVYESDKKTVKTQISLSNNEENIEFIIKDNNTLLLTINSPKVTNYDVGTSNQIRVTNSFEENSGELSMEISTSYNKDDIDALKEYRENENDSFSSMYDDEYYETRYKDESTKIKLQSNKNGENIITRFSSEVEENSIECQMNVKFDSNIKPGEITSENSIIVNDYSKEEFASLGQELMENATKNAQENPNTLIGALAATLFMQEDTFGNDDEFSNETNEEDYAVETNSEEDERIEILRVYKELVESEISRAINICLENYHKEAESNSDANPADFLTIDAISEHCNVEELELIDGTTLKCSVHNNVFYTKINIDGESWELIDVDSLYSEDGTQDNLEEIPD